MKKKIWAIHINAKCHDCGKHFENHKNGQTLVAKHAKKYKHYVHGKIEFAFIYNGNEKEMY